MGIIDRQKNIVKRILRLSSNTDFAGSKNKKEGILDKTNLWLGKNSINSKAREFIILIFILFSLTFLVCLFFDLGLILSILLATVGILLIFLAINIRKKRENFKKENQLEQFLIDLVGNLYGNPNILNCIQKTVKETGYPLRKEFETVLDDIQRGLLLNDALKNMIKRNSSSLIEIVLIGFIAANDKGVDLIGFLKDQIGYIREKKNMESYIRILTSGPRYTSYLIMLIPVVSIILIIFINRSFIDVLLSGVGIITLAYIIISNAIGFFLINRMINFYGGNKIIR